MRSGRRGFKSRSGHLIIFQHCVVPENIHTPTTEGIGNSRGVGGVKGPGNSGEEGGWLVNLRFQMVKFDAMQICFKIVSYLL